MFIPSLEPMEYELDQTIWFSRSRDPFGTLQNMTGGMPLLVGGKIYPSSEHLYQVLRYTGSPIIQRRILLSENGFEAKRSAQPFRETRTHPRWNEFSVAAMLWCLAVKTYQWSDVITEVLNASRNHVLVEKSSKDSFWGAIPSAGNLKGCNVLGQLWMWVRDHRDDLITHGPRFVRHWTDSNIWDLEVVTSSGNQRLAEVAIFPNHPPCKTPHRPNTRWP